MSFINLFVYIYDNLLLFVFTLGLNEIRGAQVKKKTIFNFVIKYIPVFITSVFKILSYGKVLKMFPSYAKFVIICFPNTCAGPKSA